MDNIQTNIQTNIQEGWQLTAAEIADINTEETEAAEHGSTKTTFNIRVQQVSLIEIEVDANNAEEAEEKALKTLENAPELGEVLRSDFGHRTIEIVKG